MTPDQRRDLAKTEFRRARRTIERCEFHIPSVPICLHAAEIGLKTAPVKLSVKPALFDFFRTVAADADEFIGRGQFRIAASTDIGQMFWMFSLIGVGCRDEPMIRPLCKLQVLRISANLDAAGFPTLSTLLAVSLDPSEDSIIPTELLK